MLHINVAVAECVVESARVKVNAAKDAVNMAQVARDNATARAATSKQHVVDAVDNTANADRSPKCSPRRERV